MGQGPRTVHVSFNPETGVDGHTVILASRLPLGYRSRAIVRAGGSQAEGQGSGKNGELHD